MMLKTVTLLFWLILATQLSTAQTQLSYLEKPKLSGIHIYQDSISKMYTIVAGSTELVPSVTLIYQLDSNANLIAAKQVEPSGKNITSSASSNRNRTMVTRSVLNTYGQLTANLICFDRRLKVQWSTIVESNYITYVNATRIGTLGNTFLVGNAITAPPLSKNYSFLCKINPYGEKVWELTDFNNGRGDTLAFWRLAVDNQDNTYTIGSIGRKGLLTKVNAEGDTAWQRSVFYRGETRLSSITASNGFLYVLGSDEGSTSEAGKVFIAKITAAGQPVWTTLVSSAANRFLPDDAVIKITKEGSLVLALSCTDANRQRTWATIGIDAAGSVVNATNYQNIWYESFPRDLFLGNNAAFAGIGIVAALKEPTKYPFFFKSTSIDILDGKCCFAPFTINQKSVTLEFKPVSIDFVNNVIINFTDFPVVTKDDDGVMKRLKE